MVSLATKLKDPTFLSTNMAAEKHLGYIRTFFLPGKHVKEEVICSAKNCMILKSKQKDQMVSVDKGSEHPRSPMCFCFSCNRTAHLACVGLNLEKFAAIKSPFLCEHCLAQPDNQAAVQYYASAEWGQGLSERRKAFLKPESIKSHPRLLAEQLPELPWEQEDVQAFKATPAKATERVATVPLETLNRQKKEMEELGAAYAQYQDEAKEEILRLRKQLEEAQQKARHEKFQAGTSEFFKTAQGGGFFDANATTSRQSPETAEVTTCESMLKKFNIGTKRPQAQQMHANFPNKSAPNLDTSCNIPNISLPDLDESTLTASEQILLSSTRAQIENVHIQKQSANTRLLELKRKALPKIATFKGDVKFWITFKKEVTRYRESGCYDDDLVKLFLYGALEGAAKRCVEDMIDRATLDEVLKVLEKSFGHLPTILKAAEDEILHVKIKGTLVRSDVVHINSLIQSYFTICRYANYSRPNTNILATYISDQLNPHHRMLFSAHCRILRPLETDPLPDLDMLYTFLDDLSSSLDFAPKDKDKEKAEKPVQMHSISTTAMPNNSRDYRFVIRDVTTAIYQGYNMASVNALTKKCLCCQQNNHFTLECPQFKAMTDEQRSQVISSKGICANCLLTAEHRAAQCNAKPSCGKQLPDNSHCTARHHIILHNMNSRHSDQNSNRGGSNRFRGTNRRSNTNRNAQHAQNILNEGRSNGDNFAYEGSAQLQTSSAPPHPTTSTANVNVIANPPQRMTYAVTTPFQVQMQSSSSNRTIKVFQHYFYGPKGRTTGYSVGDSGSEITIMREDLREQLGITGTPTMINIQWTDCQVKSIPAMEVALQIKGVGHDDELITLSNCYALDYENFSLPARSLDVEAIKRQFPYLQEAEFESYHNAIPILLIGSPHAACIEAVAPALQGGENRPVAIKTRIGWSIYGGAPETFGENPKCIELVSVSNPERAATPEHDPDEERISNEELHRLLTYHCSIESLGIRAQASHVTDDERKANDLIAKEMRTLPSGSIEVPLIWDIAENKIKDREGNLAIEKAWPKLPNNHSMALKRQLAHEKKLAKRPEDLKAFNKNFQELIAEGYARLATEEELNREWPNTWYLPMSLVVNENKNPKKYRNVYDASARYLGVSLNDRLLMGQNLLVDILRPIFRMRMNKIAFNADVKSMFHRVFISERDQQCQRILWRPSTDQPMQTYVMQVMLFGPKSSPFCSQYVKNHVANKWRHFYPDAANLLEHLTYMDDVLTSEATVCDAINVARQAIEIMKSINWDLIGFQSNNMALLKALPDTHVKQQMIPLLSDEIEHLTTKVLGCAWDPKEDCYVYQFDRNAFVKIVTELDYRPTKRDQSSTVARLFDILGLVAPFTIRGRILLQRSWRKGVDWDEKISEEDALDWSNWLKDIENIAKLRIPRQYCKLVSLSTIENVECHVFCDAGKEAFAAVAYFVVTAAGSRHSSIVLAKAKVTPVKLASELEVTEMPRLECMACLIASRLLKTIIKMHPDLKVEAYLWSDSEIVLRWIKKRNHRLPKYATSPIDEILENSTRDLWYYVPSKENPADYATKFHQIDFSDPETMWFKGPPFLLSAKCAWPAQKNFTDEKEPMPIMISNINIKPRAFVSKIKLPPVNCPLAPHDIVNKFRASIKSDWLKLLRATARALKFYFDAIIPLAESEDIENREVWKEIKSKNESLQFLSAYDIARAELFLVRKIQHDSYAKEIKQLRRNQPIARRELEQLNVFLDEERILRINSRVELDPEMYPNRFVPVLPRDHPMVKMMLFACHIKYNHVCTEAQIADIRAKYWIPQIRQEVNKVKRICNHCGYRRAQKQVPIMAPLPNFRVDPTLKPFQVTAMDCTGAITVYKHYRPAKVYLLLFTCALTRYVHVHIVDKLDTLCVLEAITQFWTAYGPVAEFLSDNGRNFIGAARRLKRDQEKEDPMLKLHEIRQELRSELATKYALNWRFIPPYSPWFGGLYERLIREIKRAIEGVVYKKKVSKTELNIAVQDAAHRLNCRPLTYNSISAEDEPVLTPHLLAKGRSGWPLLPSHEDGVYYSDDVDDRIIYHRGRKIADQVMQRFTREFLNVYTRRDKWFKEVEDLKVGDLVLVIDPTKTRTTWPRARIIDVHQGRDKRVRVADIKFPDGTIYHKMSAQRLAKLDLKTLSYDL